ncbi:hypothetical protein ATY76_22315 [Rhizobium sp. R339]|uniref:hypothetical protein n=1 Tax=Rhizobium sp. R339 TaxID=1764273 RepID=UPI000B52E530|nr:hypothetical protein [Rhizobium sp. R339]OWV64185.1 hypothetical protein ATY76_22315 [Rhizobium sp. R339]
MARLSKKKLLQKVIDALQQGGLQVDHPLISAEHPFQFTVDRHGTKTTVKVYIWNVTHGGNTRGDDEYRIQITSSVSKFAPISGGINLVLGWSEEFQVFAAFDMDAHPGELGSSPSFQIDLGALREAGRNGAAIHRKGGQETAAAIRPDHFSSYMIHYKEVHAGSLDHVRSCDEVDFKALTTSSSGPRFGTAQELAYRKTVLERLDDLEKVVGIAGTSPMMGHNGPPKDENSPGAEGGRDELMNAAADLKTQLSQPAPDLATVGKAAGTFQRLSRLLKQQIAKAGETLAEKAREHAIGILLTTAISLGSRAPDVISAINGLLNAVSTWLASLF